MHLSCGNLSFLCFAVSLFLSNADNASNNGNNEDIDLDDWTLPGADLVQKMVSQVEFYLSDENLAKDTFLLKHVKRNRMGYVNIKLLTSFKKVGFSTSGGNCGDLLST